MRTPPNAPRVEGGSAQRAGFRAASRGIGVISGAGGRGVTAGQSLEWRRRAEEPRRQAVRDREPLLSSSLVRIAY